MTGITHTVSSSKKLLRKRLLSALLFITFLYVTLIYGSVRFFLYQNFESLEAQQARHNLLRGTQLLRLESDKLLYLNEDPKEAAFLTHALENLGQTVAHNSGDPLSENLRQNLLQTGLTVAWYAHSPQGPFVFARLLDNLLRIETRTTLDSIHQEWMAFLNRQAEKTYAQVGLWAHPHGIEIIAGRYLQPENPDSPILWIGKNLSADLIAHFRITSQVRLYFWNPLDPALPTSIQHIQTQLTTPQTVASLTTENGRTLSLYTMMQDISQQKPALILQADTPKDISRQGEYTMWVVFCITLLSAPFAFLVLTLLVQIIGKSR